MLKNVSMAALLALTVSIGATKVKAQTSLVWQKCLSHYGKHGKMRWSRCETYPVRASQYYGYWTKTIWLSAKRTRETIKYPRLTPIHSWVPLGTYPITGYSWGCGTPNGITATGTIPEVGTVSSDFLPFGTKIYVPSLNYYGVVLDDGVGTGGFDLFAPSCSATYAYTGSRTVYIYR